MRGSQWRQDQAARLTVTAASLTAKLHRLPGDKFRSAIRAIQQSLKNDPEAPRQTPDQTRALILDWAQQLGPKYMKIERHERPVI
jgi:hypothetical protein